MNVKCTMIDGSTKRRTLGTPAWTGRWEIDTGLTLRAIWLRRDGNIIIERMNIWQKPGTQYSYGTEYVEVSVEGDDGAGYRRIAVRWK